MIGLVLITLGICIVCSAAIFWYFKQARERLIDQHPDTFLEVARSAVFFPPLTNWILTKGSKYKELGDEELNRCFRNVKRLYLILFLALLAYVAAIFTSQQ